MELRKIEISSDAPEDIVQFIKHLEENLDSEGEFDSDVWIETVRLDEVGELPGQEIPTRNPVPNREQIGVRVYGEFVDNSDAPNHEVSRLARSFFDEGEYVLNGSFEGGEGEFETYIFLVAGA